MTKSTKIPMSEKAKRERHLVLKRKYKAIRALAEALIKLVHHKDADGRDIGYDYGSIHATILRKFPTVRSYGPHRGQPTKMPIKELHEIACELNRNGVKLPFRPRRRVIRKKRKKEQRA